MGRFLSQGFQVVIRSVHRLSDILLTCPAQIYFRLLACSITPVTLVFSLTYMFLFLSWYVMFKIRLSIFVCAAASLFFACVVSANVSACYMSLLEVRTSCRLVSLSMFHCYPWRCRGAWRMLSIRPWFFFESHCLGFCLWCCIYIPGRCSLQRSRSECCWHILVCRFPSSPLSSTCSSSDPDCHFYQLIPVAFVVAHLVY